VQRVDAAGGTTLFLHNLADRPGDPVDPDNRAAAGSAGRELQDHDHGDLEGAGGSAPFPVGCRGHGGLVRRSSGTGLLRQAVALPPAA